MKLSGKNINIKHLLLSTLGSCLLLFTTPGCIKENFPTDCPEPKEVVLQMSVATKADGDGTSEEAPSVIEGSVKTLRVYAFTGEELVGSYDQAVTSGTIELPLNFLMHVEMNTIAVQKVDFYVIANEGTFLTGNSQIDFKNINKRSQLDELYFNSLDVARVGAFPNIDKATYWLDMSTAKAPDLEKYPEHENHQQVEKIYTVDPALGTPTSEQTVQTLSFSLKRPVGKMKLYVAAEKKEGATGNVLRIFSAKILNNGTRLRNYVMPQPLSVLQGMSSQHGGEVELVGFHGMSSASNAKANQEPVIAQMFNGTISSDDNYNAADRTNPEYFTDITEERAYYPYENPYGSGTNGSWSDARQYVADETINHGTDGNVLRLDYSFNNTSPTMTGYVYLPPIERNHFYKIFCIFSNTGRIMITYNVTQWENDPETDDWTDMVFAPPQYLQPRPITVGATIPYDQPTCEFVNTGSEDGAYEMEFEFTGPADHAWRPTLLNASTGAFSVKVYRKKSPATILYASDYDNPEQGSNGDWELMTDPEATYESGNPFIISVNPLGASTATVNLAISYFPIFVTTGSTTDQSLLLINGYSQGNYNWTNAGTDNQIIEIEQLK